MRAAASKRPSRRPSCAAIATVRRLVNSGGLWLFIGSHTAAGEPPVPAYEGHVHRPRSGGGVGMCFLCVGLFLRLCSAKASVVCVSCERMSA